MPRRAMPAISSHFRYDKQLTETNLRLRICECNRTQKEQNLEFDDRVRLPSERISKNLDKNTANRQQPTANSHPIVFVIAVGETWKFKFLGCSWQKYKTFALCYARCMKIQRFT